MSLLNFISNSKITDGILAAGSAFQSQQLLENNPIEVGAGSDFLSDIIIPLLAGVIVPFLKDALVKWGNRRKARRAEKARAKF